MSSIKGFMWGFGCTWGVVIAMVTMAGLVHAMQQNLPEGTRLVMVNIGKLFGF